MLFYYITDRSQFAGTESERRRALLDKIEEAVGCGVDYIQLREKDLSTRVLAELAREVGAIVRNVSQLGTENREQRTGATRLLINSRTDVAIAAGADGVHLRSDDIAPGAVRAIWNEVGARSSQQEASNAPLAPRVPLIGVSCHNRDEIDHAADNGANFAVFAPVFEKKDQSQTRTSGLEGLRNACGARIPVIALGGVTLKNAASCLEAGAAGIAGIRLFQDNRIGDVVRSLRS